MVDHPENRELLAWCGEQGIASQVYEPLGSSMLTGAITRETDVEALWGGHLQEWSLFDRLFRGERFERSMTVVDGMRALGEAWGATVPQLAIAWVLAQPGVTTAIVGTTNPDHARSSAAAADLELVTKVSSRRSKRSSPSAPRSPKRRPAQSPRTARRATSTPAATTSQPASRMAAAGRRTSETTAATMRAAPSARSHGDTAGAGSTATSGRPGIAPPATSGSGVSIAARACADVTSLARTISRSTAP